MQKTKPPKWSSTHTYPIALKYTWRRHHWDIGAKHTIIIEGSIPWESNHTSKCSCVLLWWIKCVSCCDESNVTHTHTHRRSLMSPDMIGVDGFWGIKSYIKMKESRWFSDVNQRGASSVIYATFLSSSSSSYSPYSQLPHSLLSYSPPSSPSYKTSRDISVPHQKGRIGGEL